MLALRYGHLRSYVNAVKNMASARDVARGIWAALERGVVGEFLLGGQDVELKAFFDEALRLLGMPKGSLTELTELPPASGDESAAIVREFCTPSPVSSEKAVCEKQPSRP